MKAFPALLGAIQGVSFLAALLFLSSCGGGSSDGSGGPPGNPPSTPSGVTATGGDRQVNLSWNASAGATGYPVKRSTTNGGPYTQIAAPSGTSYPDSGLANGTTYYYVVSALNAAGESANSGEVSATPAAASASVHVTVDVLSDRHAISPYVYGTNFPNDATYIADSGTTLVRWGGNASTRYNWVNFDTNAANDFYFVNRPMGNPPLYSDSTQFVSNVKAAGGFPLITVGMLPWVAKDATSYSFSVAKYGSQCKVNPFNSDDGNGTKGNPTCSTPANITGNDAHDAHVSLLDGPPQSGDPAGSVYRNQWVAALAAAFGGGVPHFYNLDNEIDIWAGTHRDVHPIESGYNELRDRYLTEARGVRTWDPQAVRFGPVSCCWYFYWNLNSSADNKSTHAGIDFLPWWLNEVAWSDLVAGARSLDVFDVHAYTEVDPSGLTTAQQQALALRITRDWWDPSYTSEAWFGTNSVTANQPLDGKPFRIPRMRALVNAIYPGTPLSFTEWNFAMAGADSAAREADFSTALADVDAWGILGRERVAYSTRWTAADRANPAYNSLKLFRNYDGSHHGFGTISVSATHDADPNLFSSYAALNASGTTLTVLAINKDPLVSQTAQFALNGFTPSQVTTYTLSKTSPTRIVASSAQAWSSNQALQPYSATLFVITGTLAQSPSAEWELNPDTILVPAGGTVMLSPKITSGSGTVTLTNAQSDAGITVTLTQPNLTTSQNGTVTVTAGNAPAFYHYTVTGSDSAATQSQSGWIVVGKPSATLSKTGDNQSGPAGSALTLTATLNPGSSGGAQQGASIFFTTDAGSLSSRIVGTDSSGKASVVLTLPNNSGAVHVTAEGPIPLGHPVVTFTETVP